MRKRTIKKQVWLDKREAQSLQRKAKKTGLNESSLIRSLICGYEPLEKPDERFYDVMREMHVISNCLLQISQQSKVMGCIDASFYQLQADKWDKFQLEVKKRFLVPENM